LELRIVDALRRTKFSPAPRALLGWSQEDLARETGLSYPTIARLEAKDTDENPSLGVVRTLERCGVEFLAENGTGSRRPAEGEGGYRVEVSQPGHTLPHVLKDGFLTESGAKSWVASKEGQALVEELGKRWWRQQRKVKPAKGRPMSLHK
jgi:transcriptional regulator with XRE-family HTH domain